MHIAKNGNRSSEHAWYYISTKDMSVRTKNANDSVVEIIKIIQSLGYTIHMKYIQNDTCPRNPCVKLEKTGTRAL